MRRTARLLIDLIAAGQSCVVLNSKALATRTMPTPWPFSLVFGLPAGREPRDKSARRPRHCRRASGGTTRRGCHSLARVFSAGGSRNRDSLRSRASAMAVEVITFPEPARPIRWRSRAGRASTTCRVTTRGTCSSPTSGSSTTSTAATTCYTPGSASRVSTRASAGSSEGRRRGSSSPSSCGFSTRRCTTAVTTARAFTTSTSGRSTRPSASPDSALRRPLTLNHAIQRLMVLDAIVEDPEMIWLGTAEDKANHLTALTGIKPEDLPHLTVGDGERRRARYFPDRLPIGIHLAGRGVLVYVVLDPTLNDFRLFLERHSAVLRALPAWTVRVVVPPQFSDLAQRVKQAFFTQLAMPALSPEDIADVRQRFESVGRSTTRSTSAPRTATSRTATNSPHRSTTCCSSSGRRRAMRPSPVSHRAPFTMPCSPGRPNRDP